MIAIGRRSGTTRLRTKAGQRLGFTYFGSQTSVSGVSIYTSVGVVAALGDHED